MTRLFILAAALSAAVSSAAWGQTGCDDTQKLRIDEARGQANAAFEASATEADNAYRKEFQTANATYAEALANVEAAYEGSLYWVFRNERQPDRSTIAGPVAAAVAKRAHDRNAAHREWASSVSDMMFRWADSMEEAETRRSISIGAKARLIEKQLSDCR